MSEEDEHRKEVQDEKSAPPLEKPPNREENSVSPESQSKKEGDKQDGDPNQKGKSDIPKWSEHRFDVIPVERAREIQSMGGKATKGIKKKHYSKCIVCDIRQVCRRAFEEAIKGRERGADWNDDEARCVYEIEGRQAIRDQSLKDYNAFVSADPVDLLEKIQTTFKKLEETVEKDPSYTKITSMLYLMMNIYRLKFGEKVFTMNVHKNMGDNPSLDIKEIMKEIQKAKDSSGDPDGVDVPKND